MANWMETINVSPEECQEQTTKLTGSVIESGQTICDSLTQHLHSLYAGIDAKIIGSYNTRPFKHMKMM